MPIPRWSIVAWLLLAATALADNPILTQLVDVGVPVGSGAPLKLPPPTLPDGLDAAGQMSAMREIADANHPVDALLRKSNVAPFQLKIRTEDNASGERTGRRVDIWFVVYGELSTVTKEGFLQERFGFGSKEESRDKLPSKTGMLTAEELKKRNLTVTQGDGGTEGFTYALFSVFDRVQVCGTARSWQTLTDNSVTVAAVLDTKFVDDAEYPNRWWPIERSKQNTLVLGDPLPYAGYGSYVKVTKLIEPQGALFVEYHLVFDEPQDWFDGANLLRSKLPVMVQDNIRKFRRELARGPGGK